MKKQKNFKRILCVFAMVLVFCVTSIGSIKVNASETEIADSETVEITIDNSKSHLAVRFYPDTNDTEDFEFVGVSETKTYTLSKDSVARIRLYIQANGYYVQDGYTIAGATKLTDDDRVNIGWCRAAYTITADTTKTITIPEASVCKHPYADPTVRWGYYDCEDGTHAQECTLCATDIPDTIANHTLEEMTATEYAEWFYNDDNFNGISAEQIASMKAEMIAGITSELGVDANTKINVCKMCGYTETIKSETPAVSETPSETPAVSEISTSIKDESGILPEGTTISSVSVTSGDTYEKAAAVVKEKISGLGQFAVMEINLTDASNVQIHELNGYVQVSIPVPSNINVNSGKAIVVYRLEDNGSLTRCQTSVENGVITFSTNHFSTYIIAEEETVASPKTGDNSYMSVILLLILLLSGMGFVVSAKRKTV